jgi:LmbE family N-acetylglucosaminyl deacetylase
MLDLSSALGARHRLRVLCIGAHCDDIEIGCAATLLRLQERKGPVTVDWAVLGGSAIRRRETAKAMSLLLKPQARGELLFGDFLDGRLPGQYLQVKDFFEGLKSRPAADLILCHERDDRHQDHRIVNEMVWSTFRNNLVLEYEIPKWDGGLGQPGVYVPVTAAQARRKVAVLLRAYGSQSGRDWFTAETFLALLRMRGIECRAAEGYAEAFHGRKVRISGF